MTCSKSLQNKAPFYDLKRCFCSLWLFPTVAMLVFGAVCLSETMWQARYWGDYKYVILSQGGSEFFLYSLLYLACGAMTALHAFSFLFSTKKCNVYLSLPLTRKELYRNRLLSALPFMLMSVVLPMVVSYIGNSINYTVTPECVIAMIFIALALLSLMLLGFGIGSVFAVSVGNIFEATAYSALGIFLPLTLLYSVETIMENLINGAPISKNWHGRFAAYCIQPATMFKRADPIQSFETVVHNIAYQMVDAQTPTAADFMPMIAWFVAFALLTVLASKLLIKRKAETAGAFGSSKASVIFAAAMLSLIAFAVVTTLADKARLLVTLLCIILPALIYIGVVILAFRNKDDIRRNFKGMAVAAVLSIIVLISCNTEFFGHYTGVPEKDDVESVILCPAASADFFKEDSFEGGSLNYSPGLYGKLTTESDIEFALDLHEKTVKSLNEGDNNIGFVYKLKDGRVLVRYYRNVSAKTADESLKVVETDWYRETVYTMLTTENYDVDKAEIDLGMIDPEASNYETEEWERAADLIEIRDEFSKLPIILCNSTLTKGELLGKIMSQKELSEFKKVMAQELVTLSAEEVFYPKEKILFYLTYTTEYEESNDGLSFAPSFYRFIPVYPSMTKTLEFLSKYNINLEDVTAEDIKRIKVVPYKTVLKNSTMANTDIFYAVDKRMIIERIEGTEDNNYYSDYSDFERKNGKDIILYEDRATIEKFFSSFRGAYAPVDNEGYIVRFVLEDDTYFYAFVPA